MVMTVLEGRIDPKKSMALKAAYISGIDNLPPQIHQMCLVNSLIDPTLWQIITIWRSNEALEEMKRYGTPSGVLMFRAAGVEPTLTQFEVASYIRGPKAFSQVTISASQR